MASIFLNLPVKDLQKSVGFYEAMGFTNNPQFSDDSAKCMVFSENIYVMLLTHERFMTFSTKPIADLSNAVSSLLSLQLESVEQMNTVADNAIAVGGKEPSEAKDHGFMQQRTIEDFDGHTWEVFYMDISQFPAQEEA
ncbi:MAG: hypothetical protein RLZZ292_3632 [Bacteroidota bacterium]|jgi:predicted lactoylglutathione lyase